MNAITIPNRAARRRYWQSHNEAHAYARHARQQVEPVLASHFAQSARTCLEYTRALRTGDFSRTRIRPFEMLTK